jgi:peptide chain release factor 1
MYDRLQSLEDRHEELGQLLCDPTVANDPKKLREYSKEHSNLEDTVTCYREYKEVSDQLKDAKTMLEEKLDDEMRDMVKLEISELAERKTELEERLRILLLPKDPNDDKNVIVEIRGAAGGDEAALFASDLYKMYTRYAETRGWKTEMIEASYNDVGGFKEVIFQINGNGAYSRLKYESGAHRVQRIPTTESGGRIHTSTSTVAVLPEVEEFDVEISDKDIRVDVYCSSGAGGQSVNTTQSAVRLTHVPTNTVVTCQDEKSQHKNKDKAMKVLRARVYDKFLQEAQSEYADIRKSAVGTGDRSERIRTYNFPQSRVTDHRIGLTLHKLDYILGGELDEIVDTLIVEEQAQLLKKVEA